MPRSVETNTAPGRDNRCFAAASNDQLLANVEHATLGGIVLLLTGGEQCPRLAKIGKSVGIIIFNPQEIGAALFMAEGYIYLRYVLVTGVLVQFEEQKSLAAPGDKLFQPLCVNVKQSAWHRDCPPQHSCKS
jgi:hypothetical protein